MGTIRTAGDEGDKRYFMKQFRIVLILLVFLASALWLWGVNDPYVGIYNANNNYLTLAVKNYFRFGFQTLHFLPTYFASNPLPPHVDYYLHHPILFFLISTIPFKLFGFHNWVVHVAPFIFSIGSLYFIYKIGEKLWGRTVGIWSSVCAMLFPMHSFFWKYIFFEQITLFFNLWILSIFLLYREKQKKLYLITAALLSFLCMLSDWYALYLCFIFPLFFFMKRRKETLRFSLMYGASVGIGLLFFLSLIYFGKGNFQDMVQAVSVRSFNPELFSHSYPFLRLLLLSLFRIVLYFTPIALVGAILCIKEFFQKKDEQGIFLLGMFIFGLINCIVLPTATWGHSYFLYLFIPFFAFTEGLFLKKIRHKTVLFYICLVIIVATSIAVNFAKIQQVRKQSWKYDVARVVSDRLNPFETIGVVNVAGDVFEQYFLHPTITYALPDIQKKIDDPLFPRFVLIACADVCTEEEEKNISALQEQFVTTPYVFQNNTAWLVTKEIRMIPRIEEQKAEISNPVVEYTVHPIIKWYRRIRDFLGVGQI